MPWILNDQEIRAILLLDGPQRYDYCLKRIVDQEQLWSLRQDKGWILVTDESGREMIPIWPHEKFAVLCATDSWAGCVPTPIELDDWLARWIPGMKKDNRFIAVFPTPAGKGTPVNPASLESDLREHLANY